MTPNKLFALVDQARRTGRPIQYQAGPGCEWVTLDADGDYCFSVDSRYRVKPEPPKPRECWVSPEGNESTPSPSFSDEHYKSRGWKLFREVMEDSK